MEPIAASFGIVYTVDVLVLYVSELPIYIQPSKMISVKPKELINTRGGGCREGLHPQFSEVEVWWACGASWPIGMQQNCLHL